MAEFNEQSHRAEVDGIINYLDIVVGDGREPVAPDRLVPVRTALVKLRDEPWATQVTVKEDAEPNT